MCIRDRVDDGMMAVLCPAGTSSIDFVYQADGLALSRTVTLAALPAVSYTHLDVYKRQSSWSTRVCRCRP